MALTNAENQARYRERHLGADGEKRRTTLFLNATTRAQLDRLVHRKGKGYSITAVIEELVASADRRITAKLSAKSLKRYYDRK
jgi:hypothetical protein